MTSLSRLSLSEVPTARPLVFVLMLWVLTYAIPWHTPPLAWMPSAALALLGWGAVLCSPLAGATLQMRRLVWFVLFAVTAMAVEAFAQNHSADALVLLASCAVFVFGAVNRDDRWIGALLAGLIGAGVLNGVVSAVQIFFPAAAGTFPIMGLVTPGRALGNFGQPNQLATLFVLALVASRARSELTGKRRSAALAAGLALAFGAGVAWTGSRTGLVNLCIVCVWIATVSWRDKDARIHALLGLAGWVLGFVVHWAAAQWGHSTLFAEVRLHSGSDVSASRLAVWRDALSMIAAAPWTGVGWGQFSRAWSLSVLPHRSSAPFDHTHNLPLQLAVELGLPAALFILGLLAWIFWTTRLSAADKSGRGGVIHRCVTMMLAVLGFHSLLEYPLWYVSFLLPAAFLLGVRCRPLDSEAALTNASRLNAVAGRWGGYFLQSAGVLIILGTLLAIWDYSRVLQIYSPFAGGPFTPLQERIETGQRSILYGYLADYGAVTTGDTPTHPATIADYDRPLHHLVNVRLLVSYAQALHRNGDDERAKYVVQRLREFHTPLSEEFFAPCSGPVPVPFQCEQSAPLLLDYRRFP